MKSQSTVVTRFAPSPTGDLHIGGARTALFNWLFTRRHKGKFLLRIEDTDVERSSKEASASIINGLNWLGLDWDEEPISQRSRIGRHKHIVNKLLEQGKAYKCFSSQKDIDEYRENAKKKGISTIFNSPWRDKAAKDHPNSLYSVRLKTPNEGTLTINDKIQGKIIWKNSELDDMVLLRSDGTPTYMLAVVVDDHDMGITHVIRGDDHLSNAARQILLYSALDWRLPYFAHIPLIHGEDGQKLSKRHGAQNITEYAKMGYLPEGIINYLCRLGWSHGNEEIFSREQAIQWFNLEKIGKGPSRLDFKKLEFVNRRHMNIVSADTITFYFEEYLKRINETPLSISQKEIFQNSLIFLQPKSKNLAELYEQITFLKSERPIKINDSNLLSLIIANKKTLEDLASHLQSVIWNRDELEKCLVKFSNDYKISFGELAKPIKGALTGKLKSPSIIDMMSVLGRNETVARFTDVISK